MVNTEIVCNYADMQHFFTNKLESSVKSTKSKDDFPIAELCLNQSVAMGGNTV